MLQELERPLNERERQCLGRFLDTNHDTDSRHETRRGCAIGSATLTVCVVLFAMGLFRQGGPSGIWMIVIPAAVIVGILAFYFTLMVMSSHFNHSRHARRFAREDAPAIRAALEDGRASVRRIVSDHAIVIQEYEDEGSAYIFDLGDGRSFYLRGQPYVPENDDAPWPARQFEIVRTVSGGRWVGIFAGSEAPSHVERVAMAEMPESFLFSEEQWVETVLPGRANEVLQRLRQPPA